MFVPPNKGVYLSQEEINERFKDTTWKIISEYKGSHVKVDIQCKICGEIKYNVSTSHIKQQVCLKCKGLIRNHTLESFNESIKEKGLIVDGEFHRTKKPCTVRCVDCGERYPLTRAQSAKTKKCVCTNLKIKEKEQAKEKIINALDKKGFEIVSGYENIKSLITIRCKKCGSEQLLYKAEYAHYYPIRCNKCDTITCDWCGKEFCNITNRDYNICYECAPIDETGKAYHKAKARLRKQTLIEIFGNGCRRCGYNKSYSALEFHHKNPENKNPEISPCQLVSSGIDLKDILPEFEDCELLCGNCHRKVHEELFNSQLNDLEE